MAKVDSELLLSWAQRVAGIEGIAMDARYLMEDVVSTALAFEQDRDAFANAMDSVARALRVIVRDRDVGQPLVGNHEGWRSFHFQSERRQKYPADMRIIFQDASDVVRIKGFGHRWLPAEVYERIRLR